MFSHFTNIYLHILFSKLILCICILKILILCNSMIQGFYIVIQQRSGMHMITLEKKTKIRSILKE